MNEPVDPLVIIFLDFDGVLVTPASAFRRSRTGVVSDPDAISALNYLIDQTGASLVVTSTWRLEYSQEELATIMRTWGIRSDAFGVIPEVTPPAASRRDEILAWLGNYRGVAPIGAFVILDDVAEMGDLTPHLIQTDCETGLTMSDAETARRMLSSN